MTQIARYAHQMKVSIKAVKGSAKVNVAVAGSILAQTIEASGESIETNYELESEADPERLRAVLRNARHGCFVRQIAANPTPFVDTVTVNGETFDL